MCEVMGWGGVGWGGGWKEEGVCASRLLVQSVVTPYLLWWPYFCAVLGRWGCAESRRALRVSPPPLVHVGV